MFRVLLYICIALVIISFLSCDNANNVSQTNDESQNSSHNSDEKKMEILKVLDERWKKGYQDEDIEKYETAFWSDFKHILDNGDDLTLDEEKDATNKVFDKFKNIVMEIWDLEIDVLSETEATVKTKYKIQFLLEDNASDQCVYEGYYAAGWNTFYFEFRTNEWRIVKWEDKACSEKEIEQGCP